MFSFLEDRPAHSPSAVHIWLFAIAPNNRSWLGQAGCLEINAPGGQLATYVDALEDVIEVEMVDSHAIKFKKKAPIVSQVEHLCTINVHMSASFPDLFNKVDKYEVSGDGES